MITIRTSELNDDELTELLRVFVIAKNQLCKDSYPSNCEKCQFKRCAITIFDKLIKV